MIEKTSGKDHPIPKHYPKISKSCWDKINPAKKYHGAVKKMVVTEYMIIPRLTQVLHLYNIHLWLQMTDI